MENFERIKKAVMQNCGGFENATNDEIMSKWASLPADLQIQYFNSIKKQKETEK